MYPIVLYSIFPAVFSPFHLINVGRGRVLFGGWENEYEYGKEYKRF